jgi:hypothetical protein
VISLKLAQQLKESGLTWEPRNGDRFALADRDMDDKVFVLNDMAAMIEIFHGSPAVMFHGTPEWALDYIFLGEAVWMPEEGHMRQRLHDILAAAGGPVYDLFYADDVFTCRFEWHGAALAFTAPDAAEAYARALLYVLKDNDIESPFTSDQ